MDYEHTCKTAQRIISDYRSSLSLLCFENKNKTHKDLFMAVESWVRRMDFTMELSELEHITLMLIGWCYIENML